MQYPIFSATNRTCRMHDYCFVTCEFKASDKCLGTVKRIYQGILENTKRNEGKYMCQFCSFLLKFSGRNNPNCKYKSLDDNFFSVVDSEEKAYLLGWIASDGNIRYDRFSISIHEKDLKCLEKLRDIICKETPIFKAKETMVGFTVSSIKIAADLQKLLSLKFAKEDSHKKDSIVRMPKLSKKLTCAFIRGYFDGDGCVSIIGKLTRIKASITSNSKLMINDIKTFVESSTKDIKICITATQIIWCADSALAFLNLIYRGAKLYLDRKYEKYLLCIERRMKVELNFISN